MNNIVVPYNFEPRDYQLDFFKALDSGIKRVFLRWHRRAGKDLSCLAYMIKEMIRKRGIYYYFLPNYQQGRKIIWEGMTKDGFKFLDMLPKELISRINNQEMLLETITGSVFRVIGTDNIDTIVGTNPIGTVFSEFSLQDPKAWEFIRPILAENQGWAIFNGTPRGKNHMYKLYNKIKKNKLWHYQTLQTLWPDKPDYSGIVSPEFIQEERDTGMDEETIEQEYGVSFNSGMSGSIYADAIRHARTENRIGDYPYDRSLPVYTYWDLGYNDPTAIWFAQHHGSKIVFMDYYEEARKEIKEIAEVLKIRGYTYASHVLPWDAEHNYGLITTKREMLEESIEQFKLSGSVETAGKCSIEDGINAVRARFSKYFFNAETCEDAVEKLSLYHRRYDTKRSIFLKEPVHDYTSHCADALRTEALSEMLYDDPFESYDQMEVITEFDPLAL